jgi:hypothetical protein
MPGEYDPNLGIFGFQEYQGSPREENIDGEPRVFRTFYGPAENRWTFILGIFGAAVVRVPPVVDDPCVVICSSPLYYPVDNFQCLHPQVAGPGIPFVVSPMYVMEPFSYRIQAWDDERAVQGGTQLLLNPDIECGVLIEIEYRKGLLLWPDHLHDVDYNSTMNNAVDPLYGPDVPYLSIPTTADIRHELAVEARTITGRTMEVVSYGTGAATPAAAAGKAVNQITSDDIEPMVGINMHSFIITLRNVPYLDLDIVRGTQGKVNNDVWFGYPAHAVLCTEVAPTARYHPSNQLYYDVEFTFVAKWAPALGEVAGDVMPAAGATNGAFVHNDKIGLWNRAWWEHPVDILSDQHWWPTIDAGESDPTATFPYDKDKMHFKEVNFHEAFAWWKHVCEPIGEP